MEIITVFIIVHLIGVVLGAGAAYTSDIVFLASTRDGIITQREFRILERGSRMVWLGLLIIVLSGLALFILDPLHYISSSKFLVKMTIVAVLIINGYFFHVLHIPLLKSRVGKRLASMADFNRARQWLLASGAISFVSWTGAIILGFMRSISYSYLAGATLYAIVVLAAITISWTFSGKIIPDSGPRI